MIKFSLLNKSTYSFRSVIHIVHSVDWVVLGVGEEKKYMNLMLFVFAVNRLLFLKKGLISNDKSCFYNGNGYDITFG
jgi:hypothetical protein